MQDSFVLRNANVLDESGGFSGPLDVHVGRGRIQAVGANLQTEDAVSVDFSDVWLLPGVFDCHSHLTALSLDPLELMRTPVTLWALEAAENARRSLEAGVTFVRDPGGADAGIRTAIERGIVAGPRLQIAVVTLSQTGGHADGFLQGPGLDFPADYAPPYEGRPRSTVDGVDGMRRAVRMLLRAGADWIKLCTTGGVISAHDEGDEPELTLEEIEAAVFEAARKGRHVMAHAFGGQGLDNAVRAGARSIEHGMFLTEEQAASMARSGCWLVPTLLILNEVVAWAEEGVLPPHSQRKALGLKPHVGEAVRIARDYGVKIAVGSDFVSRDQHGRNLQELTLLHQCGLTPEEALLAATIGGAELCDVAATYGRIAPGFVFDAVTLDEDPGDLSCFSRGDAVSGVFKGGTPVVPHARVAE